MAKFSLRETIQLSLPKARILPAVVMPAATNFAHDADGTSPAPKLPANAPLSSWETRPKNAVDLNLGTEPNIETAHTIDAKQGLEKSAAGTTPDKPPVYKSPTFGSGNQFDPPVSAEPAKRTTDPTAARPEIRSLYPALTTPDTASTAHLSPSVEATRETPTIPSETVRPPRNRWPRVAAAVLGGPILGTLLGFYGLLWMKGPSADYLRLTKALPAALLPQGPTEAALAQDRTDPLPDKTGLVTVAPNNRPVPVVLHRDEQVHHAAALHPPKPRNLPDGISAETFGQLVVKAKAAVSPFVQGSLSDQASLKRKGQAYMALCRLAEQFGFMNELGLSPQSHQQIRLGQQVFRETTTETDGLADLSQLVSRWWEYQERTSQGIFFVGHIGRVEAVGSQLLCHLALVESTGVEIAVLFDQLPFAEGEIIGVVGRISNGSGSLDGSGDPLPYQIVIPHYCYALNADSSR
ncbi:MAG: hypothetical protein MK171_07120 [Pirellulales bacterium]|nr:hypothetical protein [Pirellulales bacterium]